MTRVPKDPKAEERLKKLKSVPVERIRAFQCLIVDVPIGDLSLKDSHRAIYLLSATLVQAQQATNRIADIFTKWESGIKKIIEEIESTDKEFKSTYILEKLKDLIKIEEPKQDSPTDS